VTIELDPVDRITADAVGEPGERTFFLQARRGDQLITLLVEKQQVQLLAASVVEILARIQQQTGEGPPEDTMALEEPLIPEWRAGRLSIGYEQERDLLVLEAVEELPAAEDEEDDEGAESELEDVETVAGDDLEALAEAEGELEAGERAARSVRFWATREQMLSLARHGAAVCAAGRPRCQLCGNPLDPEGHVCTALNGHREMSDG
jgi:uncharacterized repeat protein (TIGR03847 family)